MERPDCAVRPFARGVAIDPASPLLALNNTHAAELSALSPDAMARLIDGAFRALRVGEADAFLIAFDQDAE
jgi:predicted GNAT superfamily acetyltransferase